MKYFSSFFLFLYCSSLSAGLVDRGSGLIYDTDQNITWLADANLALTSNYDADGRLTHENALNWAENLIYSGFDNWRLPKATNLVISNDNDSELGYMFYEHAGGQKGSPMPDIVVSTGENGELLGVFEGINTTGVGYWLSDKDPLDPNKAFVVHLHTGLQYNRNANSTRYAWAVHDGDIASNFDSASVPVPASAFLFGSALLGLIVTRRKANP